MGLSSNLVFVYAGSPPIAWILLEDVPEKTVNKRQKSSACVARYIGEMARDTKQIKFSSNDNN